MQIISELAVSSLPSIHRTTVKTLAKMLALSWMFTPICPLTSLKYSVSSSKFSLKLNLLLQLLQWRNLVISYTCVLHAMKVIFKLLLKSWLRSLTQGGIQSSRLRSIRHLASMRVPLNNAWNFTSKIMDTITIIIALVKWKKFMLCSERV